MCVLESELENQLGEFHIKMKGTNETLTARAPTCLHSVLLHFLKLSSRHFILSQSMNILKKKSHSRKTHSVWDSHNPKESLTEMPSLNKVWIKDTFIKWKRKTLQLATKIILDFNLGQFSCIVTGFVISLTSFTSSGHFIQHWVQNTLCWNTVEV